MSAAPTHVVGAGLGGLSGAVDLARAGRPVRVYEAAGHAGGRCRSFEDQALGRRIDNGNHLLLSGNGSARAYLAAIGAADSLTGPARAAFPFRDLATGDRWTVTLGAGPVPWWIFSRARRVPGSRPGDYLRALRLGWAGDSATVAGCLGADNVLFKRFWEPLAVAVLNTAAHEGAASLLWPVLRETFARGEAACRPLIAKRGLSDSFVDPALAFLAGHGAEVRFNCRLKALEITDGRVTGLDVGDESIALGEADTVLLAVPPRAAAALVPGLTVPDQTRAIVNAHFLLGDARPECPFLGLVGGTAQWLFVRGDVVSVTVSAADELAATDAADVARVLWAEVAAALDLGGAPMPRHRIVKEKAATFAQTPDQVRKRPPQRTAVKNLYLAGDWTDTGLPATIEGSIRSGRKAAEIILLSSS